MKKMWRKYASIFSHADVEDRILKRSGKCCLPEVDGTEVRRGEEMTRPEM